MLKVQLLLLPFISTAFGIFPNLYPRLKVDLKPHPSDFTGDPLFVTPYIRNGSILEARELAKVKLTEEVGIESYAGFFTVNEKYNSNHYFWYFPSTSPKAASSPVILWLQGGPGASSLYGLFTENGPIIAKRDRFETRKYHWALTHHLIYIDNPVGTGFSFTNSSKGYANNEEVIGNELYSSMQQFFDLFPLLRNNDFFISGESYAGKYVPALAYTIHRKNSDNLNSKINLQGLAIGNGWSDPINQLNYGSYLYSIGLIDSKQKSAFEYHENRVQLFIKQEKWLEGVMEMDLLMDGDLHGGQSIFKKFTGFDYYYNYLQTRDNIDPSIFTGLLNRGVVRSEVHVGNLTFNSGLEVLFHLKEDGLKSVAPWVSELLSHYRVLIYSGQLDIIVAYPLTENYLKNLNFSSADEYKNADRHIWLVDGEIAGYAKVAGNLTEVLVRDSGHMVPADQPKWALDLITRFTRNKPYF